MIDWLPSEINKDIGNDQIVYPRSKIPEVYQIIPLCNQSILVLNNNDNWLSFAVLGFFISDMDGDNTLYTCIFHGVGAAGNLRECRHTYWGEDGYLHYPDGETIIAALKELSKYFDNLQETE